MKWQSVMVSQRCQIYSYYHRCNVTIECGLQGTMTRRTWATPCTSIQIAIIKLHYQQGISQTSGQHVYGARPKCIFFPLHGGSIGHQCATHDLKWTVVNLLFTDSNDHHWNWREHVSGFCFQKRGEENGSLLNAHVYHVHVALVTSFGLFHWQY